jgi:Carboxypeptidase regulatory-like domain/TonB dependent receptor
MTRACIGIALLLAGSAAAQTTGAIAGRIVDAESDRPVAGAVVVASGPALQGEQTARTDAEGEFELGLLPPGEYSLNVQAEAHQAFTQDRLAVHAGRSIRTNLKILPDRVTAPAVRFAQQIPVLPVAGAQIGALYARDQMELIPYGRDERSFEQAALSAPGVLPDPLGLQVFGSPATGTRYRIDGLDVTSPATNQQGRRLLQQFVEEVNVESGGLGAAYGRVAGGVVQAITRSGGNDLHGSAFLDWMPIEIPRRSLRYNLAGGLELGGPIERDRLWFYGGFAPVVAATPSSVQTDYQYIGKLTFRPAEGQSLALAAISDDVSFRYLGNLLDRTSQVEATAGWHREGSEAGSLQARLQISHLLELLGRHRLAWGGETARDTAGDASRWYGAAFAQDTWSPVRDLFLEAGLRIERDSVAEATDLLPRAALAWDFSGRGTSRAYAFVGRFFESADLTSPRRTREHQFAGGVQSQVFRDLVGAVDYVHKDFRDAPDGRSSYDGVTLSVAKPFSASSLLQASYTVSSLRGTGNIAGDAPNAVKLDAAYAYEWDAKTTATFGTSFRALQTSPWQTTLDVRFGVVRALTSPYLLTFTIDGLNLFDQEANGMPPFALRFGARLSF